MSTCIVDRQALLYPISLLQPLPHTEEARHNIKNITDAVITLQLQRAWLAAADDIYCTILVARLNRLDVSIFIGRLSYSQILRYDAGAGVYKNTYSRVYIQPGATLKPDETPLRLNNACLRLYTRPVLLAVLHKPIQVRVDNAASTLVLTVLSLLTFATVGYNTLMSTGQGTLMLTGSPGLGLGVHPVSRAVYPDAILSDLLLHKLTNKNNGLVSINGYTGNVIVQGGPSVALDTSPLGLTVVLKIQRRSFDPE